MDTDLDRMSREQLVEEVKRLRKASGGTATVAVMNCVGIIQRCGDCCRRRPIPFLRSRTGLSSSKVV